MRRTWKRAATAAGVTLAAAAIPLTVATSAQADQMQCLNYLKAHGYVVGSGVERGCSAGSHSGGVAGIGGYAGCYSDLQILHVKSNDAAEACALARGDG
ncbi:hypothetical protein GCM10009753_25890 [Streptantibioticus ferralitis]